MDTSGLNGQLGETPPICSVQEFSLFKEEFSDLYDELGQFLDELSRSETEIKEIQNFGLLMNFMCDMWTDLKTKFEAKKCHEVVVCLVRFAMFASEPKKPSGIGSKSKNKDGDEVTNPFPTIEEAVRVVNRLQIEIESLSWLPKKIQIEAIKARSAITEIERISKKALFRSQIKTFREYAIYGNLVEVFGNEEEAKFHLDSLLLKMKELGIDVSPNVEKWFDRVRTFQKRQSNSSKFT